VLNAQPATDERFTRQIPLLGPGAHAAIGTLRVGLVGAGGTGSNISLALAYLGFRDFVILDDDLVDTTNLNRLVTADQKVACRPGSGWAVALVSPDRFQAGSPPGAPAWVAKIERIKSRD